MYYPFIRGKQFELLMLREMAPMISQWEFVPIIEPVRRNLTALRRTVKALIENNCRFILIVNPIVGELKNTDTLLNEIVHGDLRDYDNYSPGINLTSDHDLDDVKMLFKKYRLPEVALIHWGFKDGKGLSAMLQKQKMGVSEHIFVEHSTRYRKHFQGYTRVVIEGGFEVINNKDYPDSEEFSELYLTYGDLGADAFGDFLIIGKQYKDGGGPAWAVAIHLTYKDSKADDIIAVKHYKSDTVDTRTDPAGKFLQALRKLNDDVRSPNSQILRTKAVEEYLRHYKRQHFPGLGYVKKLSMQHHLELMAHVLIEEGA